MLLYNRAMNGKNNTEKSHNKKHKKMGKIAAAITLTAAVVVGSVFSGPDEITGNLSEQILNPNPVVLEIETVDDADSGEDQAPEETKKSGIRARIKAALMGLPLWARVAIVTPLWALGYLILWAGGLLVTNVITPYLGAIISGLIGFAVLAGLFVITAKGLFPDLPLKKILSKKNLCILIVLGVLCGVADAVGPMYYKDWTVVSAAVKLAGGLLIVNAMLAKLRKAAELNG